MGDIKTFKDFKSDLFTKKSNMLCVFLKQLLHLFVLLNFKWYYVYCWIRNINV